MPHANAPLTERGRLRLARCVVDDRWPLRRAADRFQVSHNTAKRWADRYRQHGPAGIRDRSSRPHRSPRRTLRPIERKICHLREKKRRRSRVGWTCTPPRCTESSPVLVFPTCGRSISPPANPSAATNPCATATEPARRRRRPLPPGLRRSPTRRAGPNRRRILGPRPRLVHRRRHHRRTGPHRQRRLLPIPRLARHPDQPQHHPQTHKTLPAANQRQSGTLQPHHQRRMAYAKPYHSEPPPEKPYPDGSTPTITTAPTPQSAANHPPAASPTSQGSTTRSGRNMTSPARQGVLLWASSDCPNSGDHAERRPLRLFVFPNSN